MISWARPSPQSKWHLDWFSCFRTGDRRVSLYITMGALFPKNCPFPWEMWTPGNTWFLGSIRVHKPNGIFISLAVFHRWLQSVPTLYNGTPLSPSKLPLPMGGSEPPSNTWFPGPTQVLNPNGISISSAVLAELTSVTDRQTNRPRYSVGNNRPHMYVVLRCVLMILQSTLITTLLTP